jgi:hypothetical protein
MSKFRFKKTRIHIEYPLGFLQPGMRLTITGLIRNKYDILLCKVLTVNANTKVRTFVDETYCSWTEDYLLRKIKEGLCIIADYGDQQITSK